MAPHGTCGGRVTYVLRLARRQLRRSRVRWRTARSVEPKTTHTARNSLRTTSPLNRMQQEPLGQRSSFWIVPTKSHNDDTVLHSQHDRHPKVTRRTVRAGNTAATTSLGRNEVEQREKPTMVRYRDPWTEEIIDDREMARRFHADEVIRREFDPEHGPAVPHGSRTGTRTSPGTAGTTARRTRTPG